jgi:hypothetical protein
VSRLGDSGTGTVEVPPLRVLNISLAKNFRYKERFNLKYQADFFNTINIATSPVLVRRLLPEASAHVERLSSASNSDEPEADLLTGSDVS